MKANIISKENLTEKITEFYEKIKAYRSLLSNSTDSMVNIYKNIDEISKQRSNLNIIYGGLSKYIKKIGNNPMRSDIGGGPYPIYETGLSNDILQRRGPCIDAIIQDLEYILGQLNTMDEEEYQGKFDKTISQQKNIIFPKSLIQKVPKDIAVLCDEFNFNYQNGKPHAGILLLRRILPLSIVRKFQQIGRENEIKDGAGEFLDTKGLLGKVESLLTNKRIYKEIISYKILVDSSQHSYTLNVEMPDTEGAAVKIRVLLDDIF